jgi:hypothetical protein
MWGDARNSFNAPTRRKKQRKTHIVLTDPDNSARTVKVPYSEYPAAMIFYKMQRAGILEGVQHTVDLSAMWEFVAVCDTAKANEFERRFGIKLTAKFRHVPNSFARLLAKIAYCHTLCALEPGDFRPICVPYILGESQNPSFIVGGTFDLMPPDRDLGYVVRSMGFIEADRLMLMAELRLFANLQTPTYHVVVGDIRGSNHIKAAISLARYPSSACILFRAWTTIHRTSPSGCRVFRRCHFGRPRPNPPTPVASDPQAQFVLIFNDAQPENKVFFSWTTRERADVGQGIYVSLGFPVSLSNIASLAMASSFA